MRVALTGVSGFIGRAIARALISRGHVVTGLVRPGSVRDGLEQAVDRFVTGDQFDTAVWPALLEDAACVIHNSLDWPAGDTFCLSRHLHTNLVGSIELLKASAPRQFIFISTLAVHHDMLPRWRGVIDEDHPLRPNTDYGAYKAAVEAHLWAEHFGAGRNTCAIRPCAVYGIDRKLERSRGYDIVKQLRAEKQFSKPGGGKFVHITDVAEAVANAVGNADVAGRPVNLVDCYARWGDWAAMAEAELGIDAEIDLSCPTQPKNMFSKDAARLLGVPLDRGHEGIRAHLRELIRIMG
ncbi:MAG: NAD(P)-dependent oxidoreductase [Phycisphaeraceae bacterium]|nr:NAD(P)-dependent oxidoreductase [Phycisphaeraceae bacterium]